MLDSLESLDSFAESRKIVDPRSHRAERRRKRGHDILDVMHPWQSYLVQPHHVDLTFAIGHHRRPNTAPLNVGARLNTLHRFSPARTEIDLSRLDSELRNHVGHSLILPVE